MKNLISVHNSYRTFDIVLLITRVGIAVLMLVHGLPKLSALLSDDPISFPSILGMTSEVSLVLAVAAEVICSLFILVGLGTRLAAIPLIITMLVAVFVVHASDPFARQELGLHYLLTYVVLLIAGSGKYSLDYLIQPKHRVKQNTGRRSVDVSVYQ